MSKIKSLFFKYREAILYIVFGGLTTLINIVVYGICTQLLHLSTGVSNALAWVLSVLFAYVTNRKWVFESTARRPKELLREFASFVSCRLGTGAMDQIIMVLGVDVFGARFIPAAYAALWSMGLKIASNVLVIILNYVFSKLIVFKKKAD
jgi:putative flippase GtrA